MLRTLILTLSTLLLSITLSAFADQHAKSESHPSVKSLDWMTGHWEGPAGKGILEENWIKPVDGSIASLVRMTGEGKTSMIEMIVIEEENNTLMLRLQQWNPGYIPRTPGPQTMKLVKQVKNRVVFEAIEEGGMKSLAYSRPTPNSFNIDIETAQGAKFQINLKAK